VCRARRDAAAWEISAWLACEVLGEDASPGALLKLADSRRSRKQQAASSSGAVEEKGSAFVKLVYSPSARIAHPPSALRDEAVRKLHCIGPCPRASPPGTPSACDVESGLLRTRAWSCIPRLLGCSLTSEACPAVLCLLLHETFPLLQVPYHELGITPVAWRCFACLAARDCASLSRLMLAADPTAAE
jgi:hypothetical protein